MSATFWFAALGGLLIGACLVGGVLLWLPSGRDPAVRASLGVALIGGGVIALAIFLVQIYVDERRQSDVAAQNLRLTLGLSPTLRGIDLSQASLRDIYLAGRDLSDARLDVATLDYANLASANLNGADASSASLRCANLNLARLTDALFVEADLRNARLVGANATNAKLFGTDFRGADLTRAILVDADLVEADLRNADLSGANLSGADLEDAKLDGVRHDRLTRWPVGFQIPASRPDSSMNLCR